MAAHANRSELAGSVILRGNPEVVLLVRPEAGMQWGLPATPVGPDQYPPAAAARAALGQAALPIRLGVPLPVDAAGVDEGIRSRWWRADVVGKAEPRPGEGIDRVAWVPARDAADHVPGWQRKALAAALTVRATVPVVIVRHGKAMARASWSGRDQARPLAAKGRRQSEQLVALLDAYRIGRLASSTSNRCVKTLTPYATHHFLEIEGWAILSEEQAADHPAGVETLMRRMVEQTTHSAIPFAVCGHRPVLPFMMSALGAGPLALAPGGTLVVHLDPAGGVAATEHHPPRS